MEADVGTTEIEIPVRYGGADGPDLASLAKHLKLDIDELVKRHTQADYIVFFLGFQPGFAYLGGLDPTLNAPRHAKPLLEADVGTTEIEIPVRYGGADGPDLASLAKHLKLDIDELVKRH
ncbi:carboxyltransferase domain-containing protein, partial [Caballeronia sp. M23-90]